MPPAREADGWILIHSDEEDLHYTQWEYINDNDFKTTFEPTPERYQTYAEAARKPPRPNFDIHPQVIIPKLPPKPDQPSSTSTSSSTLTPSSSIDEDLLRSRKLDNLENSARKKARLDKILHEIGYSEYYFLPEDRDYLDLKLTIEGKKESLEFYGKSNRPWQARSHLTHPCACKRRGRVNKHGKVIKREFREHVDEITRTLDYCY